MRSQKRQQIKSWWNTQGLATMSNLQQFSFAAVGVESRTLNPARVISQKEYNHWIYTLKKCTEPLSKLSLTRDQCGLNTTNSLSSVSDMLQLLPFSKANCKFKGKVVWVIQVRVCLHGTRAKHGTEKQKTISSARIENNPPQKAFSVNFQIWRVWMHLGWREGLM